MKIKRKSNSDTLTKKQIAFIETNLKDDQPFKDILVKALDECIKHKEYNHGLSVLALSFGLYNEALYFKRIHLEPCPQNIWEWELKEIAAFAAKAQNWNVFIRAHLELMFDHNNIWEYGSYGKRYKKQYVKELEEVNLNTVDFVIGSAMHTEKVSANHYFGTTWRLGWAMSESKYGAAFEEKALAIMKDERLDRFNRELIFTMYRAYLEGLGVKEAEERFKSLRNNISSFPVFIQSAIQRNFWLTNF